ncbi:T7SS effector LXG polymorphic toxin [Cerasibacillus sp. JNUCC 74]
MADRVDISEVIELSNDLKTTSTEIKAGLDRIKSDIDQIVAMDSFSGKAAKQAKNYFSDLHNTILDTFNKLFIDLANNLNQHLELFQSEVDSSQISVIDSNYLTDTKMDLEEQYAQLSSEYQTINRTISNVVDITNASVPSFSSVENDENRVNEEITDLKDQLASFTSEGKQNDSQTKELLHHIEVTMNNAGRSRGQSRFSNYTIGTAYVGLPVLKDYISTSTDEKDKIENLDKDSKVIIDKAKEDYDKGLIDKEIYDAIYSGVINTGAGFIRNSITNKVTEQVSKPIADVINKWIADNTNFFRDRGFVAVGVDGKHTVFYETPSLTSQMVRAGARNAVPIVGSVIDFSIQLYNGEDATDAAVKATGHLGAGLIGAQIGTLIGGGIGTGIGFGIGVAGSMLFDVYYDNRFKIAASFKNISDNVVDTVKDTGKKIGDAVSGFFGNLGSVLG